MTSKEWADDIIGHICRVREAAKPLGGIKQGQAATPQGDTPQSPSQLNGAAIAQALADYMKTNNSTTQALAIRIVDLAARYSQRAA